MHRTIPHYSINALKELISISHDTYDKINGIKDEMIKTKLIKLHETFASSVFDQMTHIFDLHFILLEKSIKMKDNRFGGEIYVYSPCPNLYADHFVFEAFIELNPRTKKFDMRFNYGSIYYINEFAVIFSGYILEKITQTEFYVLLDRLNEWNLFNEMESQKIQTLMRSDGSRPLNLVNPVIQYSLQNVNTWTYHEQCFSYVIRNLIFSFVIGHELFHALSMNSLGLKDHFYDFHILTDEYLKETRSFEKKFRPVWKEEFMCDVAGYELTKGVLTHDETLLSGAVECLEELKLDNQLIFSLPSIAAQSFLTGFKYLRSNEDSDTHPSMSKRLDFLQHVVDKEPKSKNLTRLNL